MVFAVEYQKPGAAVTVLERFFLRGRGRRRKAVGHWRSFAKAEGHSGSRALAGAATRAWLPPQGGGALEEFCEG
jgi:hypothetical protein